MKPAERASAATSRRMRAVRRRDTAPEVGLRRELYARGYRYFVDRPPLPGSRARADLVFPRHQVAVFVDGCFWHACPVHGTLPKTNSEWWAAKLDANVARDRAADRRLVHAGWRVVRVWSHLRPEEAADAVERALAAAGRTVSAPRPRFSRIGGAPLEVPNPVD